MTADGTRESVVTAAAALTAAWAQQRLWQAGNTNPMRYQSVSDRTVELDDKVRRHFMTLQQEPGGFERAAKISLERLGQKAGVKA